MHTITQWYTAFRTRGTRAIDAYKSARYMVEAETDAATTLQALSPASRARVGCFVDDFIRGEVVDQLTSERDSDFINEPERAERCYDAAEFGCDGKTHADVIQDWRDAFSNWLSDRRGHNEPERFTSAVLARFTVTELWHEYNGSLYQEIG